MMIKLLLIFITLCHQVKDIRGQATQLRHKRGNGVLLYRLANLETLTVTMREEFTEKSRLDELQKIAIQTELQTVSTKIAEITSRLDGLQTVSTKIAEIASRLDGLQTVSTKIAEITTRLDDLSSRKVAQSPAYRDELIKSTLDTIQDGLASEKQHRLELEHMALQAKELFEKKTRVLENGIQTLEQTCSNSCSVTAIDQTNTTTGTVTPATRSTLPPNTYKAKDCWDLKSIYGISEDGVYDVLSPDGNKISFRCDMTTDGGGWTIVQRRGDGSVRFDKTYEEYKSFFGNLTGEFWMGNDFLNVFTRDVRQTLRVDICNWDNEARWAKYKHFSVGPSADNNYYRLGVEDYSGTAGDALIRGYKGRSGRSHNGQAFSAPGGDHDNWGGDCASHYHSGWWFNYCWSANLNGLYQPETTSDSTDQGIQWLTWINRHSFKGSEMKMRPSTSSTSSTNKPFNCPVI